jgi:hypothetical protein
MECMWGHAKHVKLLCPCVVLCAACCVLHAVCCVHAADLEAWQRIAWWEGPDSDGYLWLMIDFRAAVEASRAHGPDLVARVLVSNVRGVAGCRGVGRSDSAGCLLRSCESWPLTDATVPEPMARVLVLKLGLVECRTMLGGRMVSEFLSQRGSAVANLV